jgi:hypothetical protein
LEFVDEVVVVESVEGVAGAFDVELRLRLVLAAADEAPAAALETVVVVAGGAVCCFLGDACAALLLYC